MYLISVVISIKMGDWIDLIGDKFWNFIEYFDFEFCKVFCKIR